MTDQPVFHVYVPAPGTPARAAIDHASGVVGRGGPDMVTLDYEGNRFGYVNVRTWADRVRIASHRATTNYPTVARMVVGRDDVIHVGLFADGRIILDPGSVVEDAVADWLDLDRATLLASNEPEVSSLVRRRPWTYLLKRANSRPPEHL